MTDNTGNDPSALTRILSFFLGEESDGDWSSVRRATALAGVLMAMGVVLILVAGLFAGPGTRVSFIFVGVLVAMASAGGGAIVGMIFGVPESVTRGATAASESEEWFADNSSLERIASWLTGAIIALTFVNFDRWRKSFNATAERVSCAMLGTSPCVGEGVHAGVIMASFSFLGFMAGYLATRRYLPRELAKARADQRVIVRDDGAASIKAKAAAASQAGRVGARKDDSAAAESAEMASARFQEVAEMRQAESVVVPNPGQPDDPWAGRFGGASVRDGMELGLGPDGIVPHPSLADYYLVDLCLKPLSDEAAARAAGRPVRIYLHPSFGARQIATYQLDNAGRLSLPLAAWGAFTVGAQLLFDVGDLRLELDLAAIPTAPRQFASR